jgi:hypothetical protein
MKIVAETRKNKTSLFSIEQLDNYKLRRIAPGGLTHRIITACAKGMTAHQPATAHPASFPETMLCDCFGGILRTSRRKTTGRRQHG